MTAPARRLLMMDDDPRACRIIERVAGGLGYEALSLHQPDRFKSAYEYFQPDVIILDLCMEQIDGVELLRFLSDRRSQAQVVLMSGMDERLLATTTNLGRSMGLDMLMPMQKPVELEALRTRLKQISNLETISQSTTCAESITANQLATAIQKNEIVIHYQPIIDLRSNRLVAAEALARWIHPDEGLVPAARFIQLAQDHGLMKPLTSKLLVAAVEAAAEWRGRLSDINLFINIPPELLQNLNLPDHVFELLRFYNFSPERLVLEVTTAQDKAHLTSTIDVLTRLRIKGVRLAYDNLGIHPSCLEPTHRLPFDILKLDPQFVSDFAHSANTVAVANSIVELAGAMNCQLVAVGIEDRTTRERLAKLGCHLGQGFGIAQPMDTREFLEWAPVWEEENPIPQPDVTQKIPVKPGRSFTNALPEGYELHWYRIRSVLGSGGFGITYLAHDENLGREVAIKEYFPKDISTRERDNKVTPIATDRSKEFTDGVGRFLKEAKTLATLQHPNIVSVYSVFEANGTAYMVMEYQRGKALSRALQMSAVIGERDLMNIVVPLLEGLSFVHDAGFIHRDIKPDNIFLRDDGVPVLLDFGAARQSVDSGTQHFTMMFTPSYAPIEQYHSGEGVERQGPWTDIYSMGATLYRVITGRGPVDAVSRANTLIERNEDAYVPVRVAIGAEAYSEELLNAIDLALAFRPSARPRSVREWMRLSPVLDSDRQGSDAASRECPGSESEAPRRFDDPADQVTTIGYRHATGRSADGAAEFCGDRHPPVRTALGSGR